MCGGAVARSGGMGMCFVLLVRGGEKLEPLRRIALYCIASHCIALLRIREDAGTFGVEGTATLCDVGRGVKFCNAIARS